MHSETNTPGKEMVELDMTLASERQASFLEEDLALSSSAHDSLVDKTITEPEEKTHDETTCQSPAATAAKTAAGTASVDNKPAPAPIYVSEDAMDCNYDESSSNLSKHFELSEAQSPELFESDADDEAESTTSTFPTVAISQEPSQPTQPSPKKLTPAELILRADRYVRRRVHKFLSGVPPPPNHTVSQRDCDDFLADIKRNRSYFWADPFEGEPPKEANVSASSETSTHSKAESVSTTVSTDEKKVFHPPKGGLRNLSTAFDACEQLSNSKHDDNESLIDFPDPGSSFSSLLNNSSFLSVSTLTLNEDSKLGDSGIQEQPPTSYMSANVDEVTTLSYKEAFAHRCHDIYYNRNRFVEDFENLRVKLCDRYIGNETQSTCNVWFVKQAPSSVRKRSLLFKRNNGQSPSKRLSHLARRRRTFSSANLQGLGAAEKKFVTLPVKKYTGIMTRKGKSPRGKSPRGKSPRGKTPRSSAKKRQLRNGTPRKRVEFPKRALFQSPPADKPGPSRLSAPATVTSNNPAKIKKALFPTPKKNEAADSSQSLSYPDSRKRKSDEELENPRQKWAKSLSFDCTQNLDSSSNKWNPVRHSMGTVLSKDGTTNYGKCELSETHRKKLLWAVAEALRGKGIGMSHPQFKQYAATLGRTVRKYMPDLENKNVPRKPGSTTDRMLKLAKRHAILIVESKTAH